MRGLLASQAFWEDPLRALSYKNTFSLFSFIFSLPIHLPDSDFSVFCRNPSSICSSFFSYIPYILLCPVPHLPSLHHTASPKSDTTYLWISSTETVEPRIPHNVKTAHSAVTLRQSKHLACLRNQFPQSIFI